MKVHGGATTLESAHLTRDLTLEERHGLHAEEKCAICAYAATLVGPDDLVYLDAGSTVEELINHLAERGARYVTDSVSHAMKLAARGFHVTVLGGELKSATESLVGPDTIAAISRYHFTIGFWGVNGITPENGLTSPESNEALIKQHDGAHGAPLRARGRHQVRQHEPGEIWRLRLRHDRHLRGRPREIQGIQQRRGGGPMICTVTFNPSLDYIVRVDDMRLGAINRTAYEQVLPGGKGVNVSIVLGNLGHKSRALGFVAGFTGDELCRLCAEAGVGADFIRVAEGMTRINVKVKSAEETELNGMGPKIAEKDVEVLLAKLDALGEGDTLVISGSVPAALPHDMYERIMARLEGRGVCIVVDAEKDCSRASCGTAPSS